MIMFYQLRRTIGKKEMDRTLPCCFKVRKQSPSTAESWCCPWPHNFNLCYLGNIYTSSVIHKPSDRPFCCKQYFLLASHQNKLLDKNILAEKHLYHLSEAPSLGSAPAKVTLLQHKRYPSVSVPACCGVPGAKCPNCLFFTCFHGAQNAEILL